MIDVTLLRMIAAGASILFGILALIMPKRTAKAAALQVDTPAGQAEIRASWGGLFIGLGIAVLYLGTDDAYFVFGIAYAITALVRAATWLHNRALITRASAIIMGFEIISAIIFALPEGLF
ncbi:MAG: hypothetical protein ACFE0Q_06130 [Anaerolineae bacterium]